MKQLPPLTKPSDLAGVFALFDTERAYQDSLPPSRTIQPPTKLQELPEHYAMLRHYITVAFSEWTLNPADDHALDVVRKIGGICVRAMEQHGYIDRGSLFRVTPANTTRDKVYFAIGGEVVHGDFMQGRETVAFWLAAIERESQQLRDLITSDQELSALVSMRRIAALAAVCIQQHGAPPRVMAA